MKPVEQSPSCEPNSFSVPSHPISVSSTWIVLSHLRLRLPGGFFPSGFPIKILRESPFSPKPAPTRPYHSFPLHHLKNISWGILTIINHKAPCVISSILLLLSLSQTQIFLLRPVLEHPQFMFLAQCARTIWHPRDPKKIQFNTFLLFIFLGQQTGRQKILERMEAWIPWVQSLHSLFMNEILITQICFKILDVRHIFKNLLLIFI